MPCRSGWPSGVRGVAHFAEGAAAAEVVDVRFTACAHAGVTVSVAATRRQSERPGVTPHLRADDTPAGPARPACPERAPASRRARPERAPASRKAFPALC